MRAEDYNSLMRADVFPAVLLVGALPLPVAGATESGDEVDGHHLLEHHVHTDFKKFDVNTKIHFDKDVER